MSQRASALLLSMILLVGLTTESSARQEDARLLRFPHINGEQVVFTWAGDLYTAPLTGGEAKRLTSHEGIELFARFSPDGKSVVIDSPHTGEGRQLHLIDIRGIVG